MRDAASIRSICILRLSAIGDVCHALSTVQAIRDYYPRAQITWIVGKVEYQLLNGIEGINFVVFDKKLGWRAYAKLRKDLPQTFDVLLHMQLALRANIAAFFIKAKRKIGFPKNLSKELHSLVIDESCSMPNNPHVYDGFAAFAHAIGVPAFQANWQFNLPKDAQDWALQQINEQQPTLIISAGASKAERNWLPERYAAVADYAVEKGFKVILTGGPTELERALATEIEQHSTSQLINLVGQSNLKQLLALLGKADIVIAPDTGPAHMAVTQKTPVVGLYAHSNPARTGPYLYQDYVVESYHQHLLAQTGKTAPQSKWGKRVKGESLMSAISVQQVTDMLDRIIQEEKINVL
ncbi:glycosyltransferase family 9 protein [Catenovulum sediminis]|uniref:Glycosyltransferase family 9 protein n=1 Tax=Catenovulum sediminis TaxID=1740262 RepID=A0ABV1RG29_9ALTE|nr:glycosyltransferase family 9 protein [Catenovulum sediminis]